MVGGMRTLHRHGWNKVFGSKFREVYRIQRHTPEGWSRGGGVKAETLQSPK